ncbi:hypothetical protein C4K38_0220 [Pseudomonas chlororaphis subsp. piscium]|nr:hypothetical protein C4K38_0220 [Pseudomonas chlororaphis subsp. piscium]
MAILKSPEVLRTYRSLRQRLQVGENAEGCGVCGIVIAGKPRSYRRRP